MTCQMITTCQTLQERLAAPPGRRLMLQELLRIFFAEAVRG